MIKTKVVKATQVWDFIKKNKLEKSPTVMILFAGDRLLCCDEAVVAYVDNRAVGIATISPEGEAHDGTPTIVGVYVLKKYRNQGVGKILIEAAITQMQSRMLKRPYQVDTLSTGGHALVMSLDKKYLDILQVNEIGNFLDHLPD